MSGTTIFIGIVIYYFLFRLISLLILNFIGFVFHKEPELFMWIFAPLLGEVIIVFMLFVMMVFILDSKTSPFASVLKVRLRLYEW